jgi:phosphatidylserine/phosphatidylglycerophosphate/cardiolipin synthase-like enzyme
MRFVTYAGLLIVFFAGWLTMQQPALPEGLSFSAGCPAEHVQLLVDETWTDADGNRQVHQEIFNSVFRIIDEAEQFILLDFFLVNDFLYTPAPGMRPLSRELADRLVEKRRQNPDVQIVFITDPINTVYGSVPSPLFQALEKAGIQVVWTELDRLRDSNPVIAKPWRLFVRPFGTGPGSTLDNPLGDGRISLRSLLKQINFKANHRKLIVTEKSLLVASANPHSASSAHWNMALRIDGAGQSIACESESAVLRFSGAKALVPDGLKPAAVPTGDCRIHLLTERKIKEKVLELLKAAQAGDRVDLILFYLADRDILSALIQAKQRGCSLRVILDPNKDAFGRVKNGIPNRQSAARLVKAGIPVRWADTHGEQCHAKTLYVEHPGNTATLLLGSANYTRRNLDNYNAECDLACTAPADHSVMKRARETFDRWWSNPDGRTYTTAYETYKDTSAFRMFQARFMESTGLSSF